MQTNPRLIIHQQYIYHPLYSTDYINIFHIVSRRLKLAGRQDCDKIKAAAQAKVKNSTSALYKLLQKNLVQMPFFLQQPLTQELKDRTR